MGTTETFILKGPGTEARPYLYAWSGEWHYEGHKYQEEMILMDPKYSSEIMPPHDQNLHVVTIGRYSRKHERLPAAGMYFTGNGVVQQEEA